VRAHGRRARHHSTIRAAWVDGRDARRARVCLDTASIPLLEALIADGIVVHESRPGAGAFWRSRVLAQLETDRPWYRRQRDAWIQRVADTGSAVVDRDLLAAKLAELHDRIQRVRANVPESAAALRVMPAATWSDVSTLPSTGSESSNPLPGRSAPGRRHNWRDRLHCLARGVPDIQLGF
jgi:hypothetical protein